MSEKRKGTPIQSPFSRRLNEKSRSSHDLLSPLNTLDSKITPLPPRKHENPLSRSYSSTFPIKTENLPGAYKASSSSSYSIFKNLIQKYPSNTFCNEKDSLSTVTKGHVNVLSDSEDEKAVVQDTSAPLDDSNDFFKSCYSKKEIKRPVESFFDSYIQDPSPKSTSIMTTPLNTFIKPPKKPFPTLKVSNVQYQSIMLPSSSEDDQDLKLIFVPNDRIVSLVNSKNNNVTVPFSKIYRVQFIRSSNLPSSDWYIDFVLNLNNLNFEPFGIFPNFSTAEAIAYQDCNTLRINLAINCGLSIDSIEGLLISILRDRKAFYFTTKRDPYGEFEKTNNSTTSSPKRLATTTPQSTKSIRVVPSLETLSSSESVKLSSSAIKRSSNSIFQSKLYSPDIFERRISKRLRSSPQESPKSNEDTVHIDPNLESERIILFTYPEGELDSVCVTSHELERLAPKVWLNDTNIDFELKFLLAQLDQKLRDKIHIFNSFFYRRLSSAKLSLTPSQEGGSKTGYDLVKSWTRKVNLFEKDFLIVPICENLHWFLAIICYPSKMLAELIEDDQSPEADEDTKGQEAEKDDTADDDTADTTLFVDLDPEPVETTKILIFDSLGLASRGKGVAVINRLRTYLQLEAENKLKRESSKSACTGNIVKVPQQENYNDCGCFLLQFAEEFILSIPNGIVNKIQEQNNDMSDWFPSSLAQSRREIMRKRVEELAQDFAQREKLRNDSKSPGDQQEDRSSDIEEIVMLPSK